MKHLKVFENNINNKSLINFFKQLKKYNKKLLKFIIDEKIETNRIKEGEDILEHLELFYILEVYDWNDDGLVIDIIIEEESGDMYYDAIELNAFQNKLLMYYLNDDMENYSLLKNSQNYNL